MQKNKIQSFNFRRGLLASAVMAGMGVSSVQAIEIATSNEDLAVRFDNTVKYNYGVRTESADNTMLATPNSNDGDYNFRHAGTTVSNRLDVLTEFDVVYKGSMGFRVSAASWYDKAYENVGSQKNPMVNGNDATSVIGGQPGAGKAAFGSPHLSDYAQRYYSGPSGEILDAFVFYSTEVGDESLLSAKAGQTNVFWGETLLNPVHSVSYGQSGLDLAKLAASPGTEAKELFVPRQQLFGSFTLNSEWTFAGQAFLSWDAARLPEAGTYYGGSDLALNGGQSYLLGNTGGGGLAGPSGSLINVKRANKEYTPDDVGDFGLMAKWSPEWLDGSLGLYYRNTSDILPQAYLDARGVDLPNQGGVPGGVPLAVSTVNYGFAYGDDIDIYGISLSKNIEGVSVGSDLNVRHNMPLASQAAVLSAPGVNGLVAGLGIGFPPRIPASGAIIANPSSGDSLAATGDTLHFTLNALTTFADTPVFDSATLLGEMYYSNLLSLDNDRSALWKGQGSYRGVDAADHDNVGVGVVFTPTWYQVFPGVDLTGPVAFNVGIDGNSPVNGGGNKDTGNYSVGIGAQIYSQYFVDLKYVDAFGKTDKCYNGATDGSTPNPLDAAQRYTCYGGGYSSFSGAGATIEDRGAVYLTAKTTF